MIDETPIVSGARLDSRSRRWAPLAALFLAACTQPGGETEADGGPTPYTITTAVDDKSKLYNLIGRWYPEGEVKRLSDVTLTPEEWCKREPMLINVLTDQVEARCENGTEFSAGIALVKTSTRPGEITLLLRSPKDSLLRSLRFQEVRGPNAVIAGSPCFAGRPSPHQRFPEYEILTRQILGGRRCSQLGQAPAPVPAP
jgi:hypothetical protein